MANTNRIETLFPDGSGAPAVFTCDDFAWSFDWLGGLRSTGIRVGGMRSARKRALAICTAAYMRALREAASEEWFRANAEMYSTSDGVR